MFKTIISFENLCAAWREFVSGKKLKKDVAEFSLDLSSNLFALHEDLKNKLYEHGGYEAFGISDPKPRSIHKASVRDRVVHHAIYRILYPCFNSKFICDTYSCRNDRGVHRALRRFERFAKKVSKNNTRTCWVLKCDIQKFFASIDTSSMLASKVEYCRVVRSLFSHTTCKKNLSTSIFVTAFVSRGSFCWGDRKLETKTSSNASRNARSIFWPMPKRSTLGKFL